MSSKFLQYSGIGGNVSDGSLEIYGSSIGAVNLTPGFPVKVNGSSRLETQQLLISDTNGLQAALNSSILNPLQSDLNCAQNNILDAKTVEIKTGTNTLTVEYTGGTDQTLDLKALTEVVEFTGTPPTTLNEVVVFGGTDGFTIKESGLQLANVFTADGDSPMTGVLRVASGTAAAPGIAFADDIKSGIYKTALTSDLNVSIDGKQLANFSTSGIDCKNRVVADSNSGVLPVYGFAADNTSGLNGGIGTVSIMNSGFNNYQFLASEFRSNGQAIVYNTYPGCNLNKPQYSGNRTDSGLYMYPLPVNGVSITNDGLEKMNFTSTENISLQPITVDSIDRKTAGTMTLGGTTQTALNIGRSGVTTEIKGPLTTNQLLTTTGQITKTNSLTEEPWLVQSAAVDNLRLCDMKGTGSNRYAITAFSPTSALYVQALNYATGAFSANLLGIFLNGDIGIRGNIDTSIVSGATTLNVGPTTATKLNLARSGITTEVKGALTVASGINSVSGTLNIGASSSAVSIGAAAINTTINGQLYWPFPHIQAYGGSLATPMANITTTSAITLTPIKVNFGTNITYDMKTDDFTVGTDGKITYTGTRTMMAHTAWTCSFTDNKNATLRFYVYRSGVLIPSAIVETDVSANSSTIALHVMTTLATNQYLELWCDSNTASTDIVARFANIFVMNITNP